MAMEGYGKVTGVIQSITRGESCCTQVISVVTGTGVVNIVLSGETRVIDDMRLRIGMRIVAFYDAGLPTPLIFPPQYQAELITVVRRNQEADLKFFDENLVAEDQSLKLNIGPSTSVVTANGQRYACSPGNSELLAYYTATTRSMPPMTTPQKIIVMCPY